MAHKKSSGEWDALFKRADKDGSGSLDIYELRDLLRSGDSKMSDKQIADAFVFFDGPGGDKRISKEEFTQGMQQILDFAAKVTKLFQEIDKDGSGFLDRDEMRDLIKRCGSKASEQELSDLIKEADSSGDGKISLKEFLDVCS